MAYEGFFYWKDWARLPRRRGRVGPGEVHELRHAAAREPDRPPREGPQALPRRRRRVRGVGQRTQLKERMPIFDTHAFCPPKRPDDPHFWDQSEDELDGAIYTPGSGYVNDPQLAVAQPPARRRGARRRVPLPRRRSPRSAAPTAASSASRSATALEIDAPVVVNVAGPHSVIVNEMAGATGDMNVRTRAAAPRGPPRPRAAGLRLRRGRHPHAPTATPASTSAPRAATTSSSAPRTRTATARRGSTDPDKYDRHVTEAQWEAQVYRLARRIPTLRIPNERKGSSTSTTAPTTGSRSTTGRASTATTWRSGRAATSSRTRRSSAT